MFDVLFASDNPRTSWFLHGGVMKTYQICFLPLHIVFFVSLKFLLLMFFNSEFEYLI
jgi:hypothetical protein